jgi:hypothetical protein
MVVICSAEGCDKRAGFGNKEDRTPLFCKKHAAPLMIDVINRKCKHSGCKTSANYNLLGLRPEYCAVHKTTEMISVTKRYCAHQGCYISPGFNTIGEKRGKYCIEHKLHGMINVISKKCEYVGCTIYPTFNISGSKSGVYCLSHKKDGMINVVDKQCEYVGCTTRPSYGYTTAIVCAKHKKPDMHVVSQELCSSEKCTTRACYNYEGNTKSLYCSQHKLPGMINIKDAKCTEPGCTLIPSFNIIGKKKGLYCARHKKTDMVNVREKTCKTEFCSTQVSDKYEGYCLNCFMHYFPDRPVARNYKTKEKAVREFIYSAYPQYSWIADKSIQNATSRRRPDLCIDLSSHVLMIEIDENQHVKYDCTCQNKRIMELSLDVNHRPLILIRFNPDKYIDLSGSLVIGCWKTDGNSILRVHKEDSDTWQARLNALKETVGYWLKIPPARMIEVVQLFYDEQ